MLGTLLKENAREKNREVMTHLTQRTTLDRYDDGVDIFIKLTHIHLVQREHGSGGSTTPSWEAWTMMVCSSTAQGSSVEEDTGWVMSGGEQTLNSLSVARGQK